MRKTGLEGGVRGRLRWLFSTVRAVAGPSGMFLELRGASGLRMAQTGQPSSWEPSGGGGCMRGARPWEVPGAQGRGPAEGLLNREIREGRASEQNPSRPQAS